MIDPYTHALFTHVALEEMHRRRPPIDPCRPGPLDRLRARVAVVLIWTGEHIQPARPLADATCPDFV